VPEDPVPVGVVGVDLAADAAPDVAVDVPAAAAPGAPVDVPLDPAVVVALDPEGGAVGVPVDAVLDVAAAEVAASPMDVAPPVDPVPGRWCRSLRVPIVAAAAVASAVTCVAEGDRCRASANWWPRVPPVTARVRTVTATRRRRAVGLRSSGLCFIRRERSCELGRDHGEKSAAKLLEMTRRMPAPAHRCW
jgi:hypothetical protein